MYGTGISELYRNIQASPFIIIPISLPSVNKGYVSIIYQIQNRYIVQTSRNFAHPKSCISAVTDCRYATSIPLSHKKHEICNRLLAYTIMLAIYYWYP